MEMPVVPGSPASRRGPCCMLLLRLLSLRFPYFLWAFSMPSHDLTSSSLSLTSTQDSKGTSRDHARPAAKLQVRFVVLKCQTNKRESARAMSDPQIQHFANRLRAPLTFRLSSHHFSLFSCRLPFLLVPDPKVTTSTSGSRQS